MEQTALYIYIVQFAHCSKSMISSCLKGHSKTKGKEKGEEEEEEYIRINVNRESE